MKAAINFFLSLSFYGLFLNLAHASVSRDDEDQIAGFAGVGSSKPPIVQPSAPPFSIQDTSKTSTLSSNLTADSDGLKLKDIDEMREYFNKGFLEITPETYTELTAYAVSYKKAFKAYDKSLSLKGWNEQNDLKGLLKLLYNFNAIKEVKCRKNTWQEKTIINILGNAIQYYENLETLDLKDINLNDKAVLKLLKVLPNPISLKSLNIKASMLSVDAQSDIKKKHPNLVEFIIGTNTKNPSPKLEVKSVKDTPLTAAEIKIEKGDELEMPVRTPSPILSSESPTQGSLPWQTPLIFIPSDLNIKAKLQESNFETASKYIETMSATIEEKKSEEETAQKTASLKPLYASSTKEHKPLVKTVASQTIAPNNNNAEKKTKVPALAQPKRKLETKDILNALNKVKAKTLSVQDFTAFIKSDPTLTTVSLSHNMIGDEGAKAIAEAVRENKTLTRVALNYNSIGIEGMKAIAKAVRENKTLTTVSLEYNSIGDEGARALAEAVRENKTLTVVNLDHNIISDEGAKAIADAIAHNTTLTTVYLGYNNIGTEGAKAIAAALKVNTALTTVKLDYNNISDEGTKAMAEVLKQNTTLTALILEKNSIGAEGAKAIAEALKQNSVLTAIDLGNNRIGDEGVKALAEALKQNTALTTVILGYNNIGFAGKRALEEIQRSRRSLSLSYYK